MLFVMNWGGSIMLGGGSTGAPCWRNDVGFFALKILNAFKVTGEAIVETGECPRGELG